MDIYPLLWEWLPGYIVTFTVMPCHEPHPMWLVAMPLLRRVQAANGFWMGHHSPE